MAKKKCLIGLLAILGVCLCAQSVFTSTSIYDLDDNQEIGLPDAITALQILSKLRTGQASLHHVIVPLQIVAGLKPNLGYRGDETTFRLLRSGADQFLLPVEVGHQLLYLLVDTGSNALIVFEDRLNLSKAAERRLPPIQKTTTPVSRSYTSGVRSGVLAIAPVRIGAYYTPDMRIMLVQEPDSQSDLSLTAKGADGIIGLRRVEGLSRSLDKVLLDAPLADLQPAVSRFELNLPPAGGATLTFGNMPILDQAKPHYIFKTKTLAVTDPENPFLYSYSDLQAPFRAKSRFGEANGADLDVLFDSGAVSKLILDINVAAALGYDPVNKTWAIPEDSEIEFNLVGPLETLGIAPKFKVSEISVAPYREMGVTFEAVLGISRWQHYVIGYSYVDYESGGPDGTLLMLFRPTLAEAHLADLAEPSLNYVDLPGLNSIGDDRYPAADDTGATIVFASNRPGGAGGWDIYVWKQGQGILSLPDLNSSGDDGDPTITGDGRYIAFHSDRSGNYDIYVYDLDNKVFAPTPNLNSSGLERNPAFSRDGRYLSFRSERSGGAGGSDIYLYDMINSALKQLPNLNFAGNDYDPVLNQNGSLIAFDRETLSADGQMSSNVCLYYVTNQTLNPLANINTPYLEMDASISPDGQYLSLQTNRLNPGMGLYDRNFMIYNRSLNQFEMFTGLNSSFDEEGLLFTGDSQKVVFHSERIGGQGGSDIYMYRIDRSEILQPAADEPQDLPAEDLPLTLIPGPDVYTARLMTPTGQRLNLLVDTALDGVVLFQDRVTAFTCPGAARSIYLPTGTLNANEQTCLTLKFGAYEIAANLIRIVPTQAEYNAMSGRSDLPTVDGVIGFRGLFLNQFNPPAGMFELAFIDGAPLLDVEPGLSLGRRPIATLASEYLRFSVEVPGVLDSVDPVNRSYTQSDLPFLARADNKLPVAGQKIMLSTVLKDQLFLDDQLAGSLGYDGTSWGTVASVQIFFKNDSQVLPVNDAYPVAQIRVRDLEVLGCDAVLSGERWMSRYVFAFSFWGVQDGGPAGTIDLISANDLAALKDGVYEATPHYLPLPGLNSRGDDNLGDISDDGQTIVFESNRSGGLGGYDVYVYQLGLGLLNLPGLNSATYDGAPSISADGRLLAFESDRNGNADIFLYNIFDQVFIELPGLNTPTAEKEPDISADGRILVFQGLNELGNTDIRYYDLTTKTLIPLYHRWLNTEDNETLPKIDGKGNLLAFIGTGRADSRGGADIYLYDLSNQQILDLPVGLNTASDENRVGLSSDGNYLAAYSQVGDPGNIGLVDLAANQFVFLPGLNTPFDDYGPALSANARYIVFSSDRPGGQGDYDLYVYRRDDADNTIYTTTKDYEQIGYVQDAEGTKLPETQVRIYDLGGRLVGEGVTDASGYFSINVPSGTELPLKFETDNSGGIVVTDEVGDDTYVPDFQAGNLKFTNVWVPDSAQSGLPSTLRFDIETTEPAYNIQVRVYLKAGIPDNVQVKDYLSFNPDYILTSLVIDRLGQRGLDITTPVVSQQGDMTTIVTYQPGTDNKKASVETTFTVPFGIPDGTYTAVFGINILDSISEDNAIQGESAADYADNWMVASAATIIGNPDKPNLRILSAGLTSNAFELPSLRPDFDRAPGNYDLNLNMETESMAQDTTLPVDIVFELEINDHKYPMTFAESNGAGGLVKSAKQTYPVICRPEDREGYPAGDRCASLFRQEQTGKTYQLYINDAAYDVLSAAGVDKTCKLLITLDPDNTVAEYENNKADNVKTLAVQFLAPQTQTRSGRSAACTYPTCLFNQVYDNTWGQEDGDFNVNLRVGPEASYREDKIGETTLPTAFNFNFNNELKIKMVMEKSILSIGAEADLDIDNFTGSFGEYGVTVLGARIWGQKISVDQIIYDRIAGQEKANCEQQCTTDIPDDLPLQGMSSTMRSICKNSCKKGWIWASIDQDGNERWVKSEGRRIIDKNYIVGYIPVVISIGFRGEVGLRGDLKLDKNNIIKMEAGPYAKLSGYAEGGVGLFFYVGVGVDLTLIQANLTFTPSFQALPTFPIGIIRFAAPINISTLDGYLYLYARTDFPQKKWTKSLVNWDGISFTIDTFPPLFYGFGAVNEYKARYNETPAPTTGIINYDWLTGGPGELTAVDDFDASWEGFFEFSGLEYRCTGGISSVCQYGGDYTLWLSKGADDELVYNIDLNDDGDFGDSDEVMEFKDVNQYEKSISKWIPRGIHKVRIEYHENMNDAKVGVSFKPSSDGFGGSYYNNSALTGDPVWTDRVSSIDYNWSGDGPKKDIVDPDSFSVKWEGTFGDKYFPVEGNYTFLVTANDGVRLFVDDDSVFNHWNSPGGRTFTGKKYLTKGSHTIRLDYREDDADGKVKLDWGLYNTFVGYYYNNKEFSGDPVLMRNDGRYGSQPSYDDDRIIENIFYNESNWTNRFMFQRNGNSITGPGVNADHFSVRWEGIFNFEADGVYDFAIIMDDGMKVWVDDDMLFSYWNHAVGPQGKYTTKTMTAGYHKIRIDYVEYTGLAVATLKWGPRINNQLTASYSGSVFGVDNSRQIRDIRKINPPDSCTRTDCTLIDDDYGVSHPSLWFPNFGNDYFSTVWEGDFDFDGGPYLFTMDNVDDSMTLEVDHVTVLETTYPKSRKDVVIPMHTGTHHIKVTYSELHTYASCKLKWRKVDADKWFVQHFSNGNWERAATFEWESTSRDLHERPNGTLTRRYAGVWYFDDDAVYDFWISHNDGLRIYIDGMKIYDAGCCRRDYLIVQSLTKGYHSVTVEYWNVTEDGVFNVSWYKKSANYAIAVKSDGTLQKYTSDGWVDLPGPGNMSKVSVGKDKTLVGINNTGRIFRFDPNGNTWEQYSTGYAKAISCGNSDNVWVIDRTDRIAKRTSTGWGYSGPTGTYKEISVNPDGEIMWVLNLNSIRPQYWYLSNDGRWLSRTSPGDFCSVSYVESEKGYGISPHDDLVWEMMVGTRYGKPEGKELSMIDVSTNTGTIWGVTEDHKVYRLVPGGQWEDTGLDDVINIATD